MKSKLYTVRFRAPQDLYDALKDAARVGQRSLTSEIVWRLGKTFSKEKAVPTFALDELREPK